MNDGAARSLILLNVANGASEGRVWLVPVLQCADGPSSLVPKALGAGKTRGEVEVVARPRDTASRIGTILWIRADLSSSFPLSGTPDSTPHPPIACRMQG